MSKSDLVDGFYCYGTFGVHTDGQDLGASMVITNDVERYLPKNAKVTYAKGYDASTLGIMGSTCLIGERLAKELGVTLDGEVGLIADAQYSVLSQRYGEEEGDFAFNLAGATRSYKVIGIVESGDEAVGSGIFAGIDGPVETIYGQPFPFQHCEFVLSDHGRMDELQNFMEELKKGGGLYNAYAPMASFFVDTKGMENVGRICVLLEAIFPAAVAVAVGLLGSGLCVLQSANEAALLRVLGVTKKRARCMLVLGQVFLCIAGIILVMGGLYLYSPGMFVRGGNTLAVCFGLYFIGCILGAGVAAMQVTRRRIMDLLQVKE